MGWDDEKEVNDNENIPEIKMEDIEVSNRAKGLDELPQHETILLYSQPKVGKTWAACSFIENTLNKKGNIFYVNTDNGFIRTAKAYFKDKFDNMKKHLNFYFISDLDQLDEVIKDIRSKVTQKDLIVIDLIDDFWESAQAKFLKDGSERMNMSLIDFLILVNKENDKIGGLKFDKWIFIKKFDNTLIYELVINTPCDVIACCSSKDIDVAKVFSKKSGDKMQELSKYEEIGYKPAGQPLLKTKFNTIIFIGENNDSTRYFIVMGDRGYMKKKDKITYDKNFYEVYKRLKND